MSKESETSQSDSPPPTRQPATQMLAQPPDGGWGWVVVFGCFMIHVLADGAAYSFGVFMVPLSDYFGEAGRGKLGWIGAIMVGTTWCTGPVTSALVNKYGCRSVSITGGVIAAVGFILSIFAPNIIYLYITFGIISGFGQGLVYLPSKFCVAYYFDKRRSFATGLGVCGTGIGIFIFAPLATFLCENYGWRGATLIEAGAFLNCCVFAATFRPLNVPKKSHKEQNGVVVLNASICNTHQVSSDHGVVVSNASICNTHQVSSDHGVVVSTASICNTHQVSSDQNCRLRQNVKLKDGTLVENETQIQITCNDDDELFKHNPVLSANNGKNTHMCLLPSNIQEVDCTEANNLQNSDISAHLNNIVCDSDIKINKSGQKLANNSTTDHHSEELYPLMETTRSSHNVPSKSNISPATLQDNVKPGCCSSNNPAKNTCRSILRVFDISVFKNYYFVVFLIGNMFSSFAYGVPFLFLPDRAIQLGISNNKAAFLVSVIGITNTIGRVLFGWLGDLGCVNRLLMFYSVVAMNGVITILSAFLETYPLLVTYAATSGLCLGANSSLISVVIADLVGLQVMASAYGWMNMLNGIAFMLGSPFAGWLYDETKSYRISFCVAGAAWLLGGAILFTLPCMKRCSKKRVERNIVTRIVTVEEDGTIDKRPL